MLGDGKRWRYTTGKSMGQLGTNLMIFRDWLMGSHTLELVQLVGFISFNFNHLKVGCLVYMSIVVSGEKQVLVAGDSSLPKISV